MLTSLVVSAKTGKPLFEEGFQGKDIPTEQNRVFKHKWLGKLKEVPTAEDFEKAYRAAKRT